MTAPHTPATGNASGPPSVADRPARGTSIAYSRKAAKHYARLNRELGIAGDLAAIKHGVICALLSLALLFLIMNGPELVRAVVA